MITTTRRSRPALRLLQETVSAARSSTSLSRQWSGFAPVGRYRASPSSSSSKIIDLSRRPNNFLCSVNWLSSASSRFNSTAPAAGNPASDALPASIPPRIPASTSSSIPADGLPTVASFDDLMKEIDAENDGIGSPTEFGYLKSLGLDYGWGPTTMMEWVFEHIHIWTGSVWCLSIALTALAVRAVFVRAFIQASDMSAKMSALKPVTEPIMTKLRECQKTKDTAGVLKARTDVSAVYKRAEIKLWKPFVPLLQIFPSYGTFRLMRGMADVPVPGLETGGLLWFQDLTLPDPYLIIPLATGFILYRTIKHGAEHNTSTFMTPFAYKIVSYVVPSFTFVIMNWWPATLQLYFLFAGGLAYLQQMAFRNAILRRWLRMTPMLPLVTTTTTTEASNVFPKLNLSPRLKAETSTTTTLDADSPALAGQTKAKKLVGGAVAEVKGMVTEVQKSWASATGSNPTRGVKRTESEKRQASAYEQRRRKELDRQQSDLKQAKWERWREKQEQMAQEEANKGL